MDGWLGPGVEPTEIERRSILSRLSSCSVISSNPDGALRTRTARIEQVAASGKMLTVRLIGSGLYDDIIPNPRVIITARPAVGPHELIAVNGLARIQSRMETAGDRELLLLDVAIQRMECWGSASPVINLRPVASIVEEHAFPLPRHDAMALKQA